MSNLVKRERAAFYILLVVISFSFTILCTRLYLAFNNYPKIGNSVIHFSHVLWGGLILGLGSLLLLIFSNSRIHVISAVFIGIGLGFFIDEVGKFITQSNDYFFRPAAVIIYVFFLLIILIYIYIRRSQKPDARELLYYILDDFKEILDDELDHREKEQIENRLGKIIRENKDEDLVKIAKTLQRYIVSIDSQKEKKINLFEKIAIHFRKSAKKIEKLLYPTLITILIFKGLKTLFNLVISWMYLLGNSQSKAFIFQMITENNSHLIQNSKDPFLLLFYTMTEGVVGFFIFLGIFLFLLKNQKSFRVFKIALIFSLCAADVLGFYLYQFNYAIVIFFDIAILSYIIFLEDLKTKRKGKDRVT